MGHIFFLAFMGLLGLNLDMGLEAKKGNGGGFWGQSSLSYMATASVKDI